MNEVCAICNESFDDETFVKHLRTHKIKLADYYVQHRPKNDLFTGEPIKFKNREQYQSSLYNTRTNLVKHLKFQTALRRKAILAQIIEMRQGIKQFAYAPSTTEARTQILPSPLLFQEYGLNYNAGWKAAGAKPRYDYEAKLTFGNLPKTIYIDTREQKPLSFSVDSLVSTLKYGDYSCSPNRGVVVERKSLQDLCGTLSAGYERFQREIDRCHAAGETMVVCVETDANTLMSYNYLPQMRRIKATPEFICHRMRELCQKYPEIQFLLVKNRGLMSPTIEKIFSLKNKLTGIDLQYHFDKGDFV